MNISGEFRYRKIILAAVLITAVIVIGVTTLLRESNTDYYDTDFDELEKECAELTIEARLERIRLAEESLERIQLIINSDSINPEERHQAILTRQYIKHELEILKKHLP